MFSFLNDQVLEHYSYTYGDFRNQYCEIKPLEI